MRQPIYRAMFDIAAQLKKSVAELTTSMSLAEFYQWLAYYQTQDQEWVAKYQTQEEATKQNNMTPEEHTKYVLKQLGLK